MKKNTYLQMDLQLFDDVMNSTATPGLSAENKTFYDRNLIRTATPNLVHHQFGQKRPIPKNGGKKIEFRRFASLPKATQPLTEGITPPGQTLEVLTVESELQQYGDYVKLTDVLDLTAIDPVIVEATALCGNQGGQTMDTVVRNVMNSGTNVWYAPKRAADGTETDVKSRAALDESCVLTCDLIDQVVAFLKAQNAPKIDGYYVGIIHPYAAYDLRKDERWRKPKEYCDPEHLYNGELGEYGGVRFVDSSEAKIFAGANLAENSRTLTVNKSGGYTGKITTIEFDGGTVEAGKLIGRYVNINGVAAEIKANTASSLTVAETDFGTIEDNAIIYPGEGGYKGLGVFSTLILGKDAYGVTDIEGNNMEVIVKPKGSAGTADPLNQRSTVGWKAMETAEILIENYMVRIESCSEKYSGMVTAN